MFPYLNKFESPSLMDVLHMEEIFFVIFVNVFSLFHNYLPLEKGEALHFHKLELSLPKAGLWQVWLQLAQWFLRRRF